MSLILVRNVEKIRTLRKLMIFSINFSLDIWVPWYSKSYWHRTQDILEKQTVLFYLHFRYNLLLLALAIENLSCDYYKYGQNPCFIQVVVNWLITFNTSKIKLVTCHHHWDEHEFSSKVMNWCSLKEAPCLENLLRLRFTQTSFLVPL